MNIEIFQEPPITRAEYNQHAAYLRRYIDPRLAASLELVLRFADEQHAQQQHVATVNTNYAQDE